MSFPARPGIQFNNILAVPLICLYAWNMDTNNLPRPLRFIHRGAAVSLANVPPSRTLLELLREDLDLRGTKEGCNEGDCGACTVVLAEASGKGLKFSAVNSCIRLAHSVQGMALWTVEDIAADPMIQPAPAALAIPVAVSENLHPAQQAMLDCHGSQCGFCTPGFVMSLFGMYQNHVCRGRNVTRALAQEELSGNLCRCTGYRPILDAAQRMQDYPRVAVDEAALAGKLRSLQKGAAIAHKTRHLGSLSVSSNASREPSDYLQPENLQELLRARATHPEAQLVAGCTDVGLWVTKQHRQFPKVLDLTRTTELRRIEQYPHHIAIGAAVSLTEAYAALAQDRPQIKTFAARFAGLPVRNAGTLGGNVANGSPIGDSMPLLIALGASVVLMRWGRGMGGGRTLHRELALEQLYTGYRKNIMTPDELLAWIKVPKATAGETMRVYKISKRFDDDISAVCLALNLDIAGGKVLRASIGAGGVAATPARALRTQAALIGQPWNQATVKLAMQVLREEFSPISDMRASAAYRSEVLGALLQRFWLESQGHKAINLENWPEQELA